MKKFRAKQFIEDDFHNFDTALTAKGGIKLYCIEVYYVLNWPAQNWEGLLIIDDWMFTVDQKLFYCLHFVFSRIPVSICYM